MVRAKNEGPPDGDFVEGVVADGLDFAEGGFEDAGNAGNVEGVRPIKPEDFQVVVFEVRKESWKGQPGLDCKAFGAVRKWSDGVLEWWSDELQLSENGLHLAATFRVAHFFEGGKGFD